ncbi:MAG: chromosomal replication initiator protein DnaA [Phycisphaerales bacterium]|nr:chromosomal replication initiator protein DnaA [Phycisphaerales bacterium]
MSDAVWADILGYVRTHYSAFARGWFSQLRAGSLKQGQLDVFAANGAQLTYLREHCTRPFVEAAQAATGRLVSVEFLNGEESGLEVPTAALQKTRELASFEGETALLRLNGDYVFDNFVPGPCNRLAHASCLAVSDSPGTAYNPLFIHGNVGLGKTHLLQAICHRVLDRAPATRIMYLSCETFVNHFIEAVERGILNRFRYRYRHVDMLVIDDVQFLSGRDRTQEEFFHTFNTLYHVNKQIILSADCTPPEIPSLEERLVSRFNWGLIARVDAPCMETRHAIIRKKMKLRQMDLPEDVILLIASRIDSNTRELEGALNRIHGMAALEHRPIDLALAHEALGGQEESPLREVRIQDITDLVTNRFGVKLSDLTGRRRSRSIALPRQVCMYLARQLTHHSLEEIGGFFGGRDHTTVLHANKLISNRKETDTGFRSRLEEIEVALTKGDR